MSACEYSYRIPMYLLNPSTHATGPHPDFVEAVMGIVASFVVLLFLITFMVTGYYFIRNNYTAKCSRGDVNLCVGKGVEIDRSFD